jgi:hypothetical protein
MTATPEAPTLETPAPAPAPAATAPPRTLSILSLVAAIASVPLGHLIVLPIAAIVLGFLARRREPWARTMSTWGIVLGFVVLFWWVVAGIVALTVWLPFGFAHLSHLTH